MANRNKKGEFMFSKLLLALSFGVAPMVSSADCPSVDAVLKEIRSGMRVTADFQETIVCHVDAMGVSFQPQCNLKVGALKDILVFTESRFRVGEITKVEVEAARAAVETAKANCPE